MNDISAEGELRERGWWDLFDLVSKCPEKVDHLVSAHHQMHASSVGLSHPLSSRLCDTVFPSSF